MKNIIGHVFVDYVEQKLCSACKQWYPIGNYNKDSSRWDKLNHQCRQCGKEKHIKYVADEAVRKNVCDKAKEWDKRNRERRRKTSQAWRKVNRARRNATNREWVAKNKEKVNAINKKCRDKLYRTSKGRISVSVAVGMRNSLKNGKNGRHWEELVNYTLAQLETHLLCTVPRGYSWDDFISGKLHIDHIIPKRVFNYNDPSDIDFKKCWALENLQLLPAGINMSKRGMIDKPFQPSLALAC